MQVLVVCREQRESKGHAVTRVTREIEGTLVHQVPLEQLVYQDLQGQRATG